MKKKTILWLVIAIVAVLAAAAVVVCLLAGGSARPALYRNLDGHLYGKNTTPRAPEADGTYQLRFAFEEEVKTFTVKDEALVHRIDSMEVMGLVFDKEGTVTDVLEVENLATELCSGYFIKGITPENIAVNGSLAMNGMEGQVPLSKHTKIYDVTGGNVEVVELSALQPMDGLSAYADEKGRVTHIFVVSHPTESKIYWRTARFYSSSKKETTREPDENGVYSIDFYCDGQVVTLQAKDKDIVTAIDTEAASNPHFGFAFDADGYITEILKSALGIRGLLACESYDITAMQDGTVTATELLNNKGLTWTGALREDCAVYDISGVAEAEGHMGQAVEGVQLGDRVTVWTDTEGRATQIYVLSRLVDCPVFFSISRKYDSKTGETTRKPDADGWYSVPLLKEGETETAVYKTQDKALMSYLDSYASRCLGIRADENNVIEAVYHADCLFGDSVWSSGGVVANTIGSIVTKMTYGKSTTAGNAVMMPECKIYNVSTVGQYGAETTLQNGDYIYAFKQPSGELVHIYVVRRCLGAQTMYYNLDRRYDEDAKKTTRLPDGDGWYQFELLHAGETVTLKTDSEALATRLDSFEPGAVSLEVSDGVITGVHDPKYACGGSQVAHGNRYTGTNKKGQQVTVDEDGKETAFALAADCVIYDVRTGKEKEALQEGDLLTVYTDRHGAAKIIFVR